MPNAGAFLGSGNTPSGRRVDVVNQRFIARKLDRARRCVAISELDTVVRRTPLLIGASAKPPSASRTGWPSPALPLTP
jgi:hypothetical protein